MYKVFDITPFSYGKQKHVPPACCAVSHTSLTFSLTSEGELSGFLGLEMEFSAFFGLEGTALNL